MVEQKKTLTDLLKKGKITKLTEDKKFPTVNINVSMPKVKPPKEQPKVSSKENKENKK